jgi:hypothetical protein
MNYIIIRTLFICTRLTEKAWRLHVIPQGLEIPTIIRKNQRTKEKSRHSILHKDFLDGPDPYRYGIVVFLMEIIKDGPNRYGF